MTGDGIADLIITRETRHMDDPEMGKGGIHTVWLEPLPGVVFLSRCTPNNSDFYRVEDGRTLSADEVSAGLRFGRPMLGAFEIGYSSGGKLWITEQARVNAGETLHAR